VTAGLVSVPVFNLGSQSTLNVLFLSDNGLISGNLTALQQPPQTYVSSPVPAPLTLASTTNWNSGVIPAVGFTKIVISAELSQTGTLVVDRFVDLLGAVQIATVTVNLSASVAGTCIIYDGLPFGSFSVVVTNTGGSTANLTNVNILLGV
jgi:hypothetical protein